MPFRPHTHTHTHTLSWYTLKGYESYFKCSPGNRMIRSSQHQLQKCMAKSQPQRQKTPSLYQSPAAIHWGEPGSRKTYVIHLPMWNLRREFPSWMSDVRDSMMSPQRLKGSGDSGLGLVYSGQQRTSLGLGQTSCKQLGSIKFMIIICFP